MLFRSTCLCSKHSEQCSLCGVLGTQTRAVAQLTHIFGNWSVKTVATCATVGEETRTCSLCGEIDSRPIAKTNIHTFGNWSVKTAATCAAAGEETRTCSLCGEVDSRSIPKTNSHIFGNWSVKTAATCATVGEETRTCSVCGEVETRSIPKTDNHTFTEWVTTKEATCSAAGVRTEKCAVCGTLGSQTEAIPATGAHTFVWTETMPATCEAIGEETEICSLCQAKRTIRAIPRLTEGCSEKLYTLKVINGTSDKYEYTRGEMVTITANNAVEGNMFKQWSSRFVMFSNPFSVSTTFIMPAQNISVMAIYEVTAIETVAAKAVKIYPNPTKGELKIDNGELRIDKVEICDLTGRIVLLSSFGETGGGFDVSNLPSGIYIVKMYSEQGVIVRRLVKE